jgi:hypothetical protein
MPNVVTMVQEHSFKLPWMTYSTMEIVTCSFIVTEKKVTNQFVYKVYREGHQVGELQQVREIYRI